MNSRNEPRFGALMIEVTRLMRAEFNRRVQPLGLTQAQWRALAKLSQNPDMRQAQLAEHLEIKPITVTRLIDKLEAAGFVERHPDPDDRRALSLRLTERAAPLIEELWRQADLLSEEILSGVGDEERRRLVSTLARMKQNLMEPVADGNEDTTR